jgi:hypothetical protein
MKKTLAIILILLFGINRFATADPQGSQPSDFTSYRKLEIQNCGDLYRDFLRSDSLFVTGNRPFGVPAPPAYTIACDWSHDPPIIEITVNLSEGFILPQPGSIGLADQLVDFYTKRIDEKVKTARTDWKSRLDNLTAQFQELQQQEANETQMALTQRNELNTAMASADLFESSPANVRDLVHTLELEHETAEIDRVGKLARKEALAKALADLDAQMTANLQSDPVVEQLQKVADMRQQEFDQLKQLTPPAATYSPALNNAAAALAQAKVDVLERKEAAAKAAGADTIQSWNQELLSLSIDLSELDARTDAMQQRLRTLGSVLPVFENQSSSNSSEAKLANIHSQMGDLRPQIDQLNEFLADKHVPKVVVVESHDEPTKK